MIRANNSRNPLPPADGSLPLELRREQRLCTLFRTGKLLVAGSETICRVRNISPNGFMADICAAPAVGFPVALELGEGRGHAAKVVWSRAGRFGAEFVEPQSLSEMIAGDAVRPDQRHRALRIDPKGGFATIRHDGRIVTASIVNISQTGVAIFAFDLSLSSGTPRQLRIDIDGLDPMAAILCWTAHGAAGIQFERPLSFEALSQWLWAASQAEGAAAGWSASCPASCDFGDAIPAGAGRQSR